MAQLQVTSPLQWPSFAIPTERLARQINPQFQLQMKENEALAYLEDELDRMPQILSASLSCDAINVNSTMPTQYLTKNPGAALRFMVEDARYHLCCDRWQSLPHNIYVLHLGLRYFRQLSDWGLGSLPVLLGGLRDQASGVQFTGGANDSNLEEWQLALGIGPTATLEEANALYRIRAKTAGDGNTDQLQKLNLAIQQARKVLI